jgi:hypothetical protein
MTDNLRAMYVTDDRDLPEEDQRALVIFPGGNGDWYLQVTHTHGRSIEGVRLSTSGGASTQCPGLVVAVAEAYRAMLAAQRGEPRGHVASRTELEDELRAWRSRFPALRFDGIFDIVEAEDR